MHLFPWQVLDLQLPTNSLVVDSSDTSDSEKEGPLASGLTPQRHPRQQDRLPSKSPLPERPLLWQESLPPLSPLTFSPKEAVNTVERTSNVSEYFFILCTQCFYKYKKYPRKGILSTWRKLTLMYVLL